jgi:hypothetical protein
MLTAKNMEGGIKTCCHRERGVSIGVNASWNCQFFARRNTDGDMFINYNDEDTTGGRNKAPESNYFGGVCNGTKNWI